MSSLNQWMAQHASVVERELARVVPSPRARPTSLHQAMRHSLLGGGKRLRPLLCFAACEACGGESSLALRTACAIECVHTYSLIHDDLPCMDNDELRRGRPTCHVVYGEATALLAGDALLALAFELLATETRAPELVLELATAAGSRSLVGGQSADLEAEGSQPNLKTVRFIHEGKTAAMIAVSTVMGGLCAGGRHHEIEVLRSFGRWVGLAFQIIDDILDATQTTERLGKRAGKDVRAGKATFPAVIGIEGARKEARRLTARARRALQPLGARSQRLAELADWMLARDY